MEAIFINVLEEIKIENLIYTVRGKHVMLDKDLALLYKCKNGTKSINLAVKRNKERFPDDFCFQITMNEYDDICSNIKRGQNLKYLPYVFTEQGVAMLSSILKTEVAITTSVNIMRAFVLMRNYISENLIEQKFINELEDKIVIESLINKVNNILK